MLKHGLVISMADEDDQLNRDVETSAAQEEHEQALALEKARDDAMNEGAIEMEQARRDNLVTSGKASYIKKQDYDEYVERNEQQNLIQDDILRRDELVSSGQASYIMPQDRTAYEGRLEQKAYAGLGGAISISPEGRERYLGFLETSKQNLETTQRRSKKNSASYQVRAKYISDLSSDILGARSGAVAASNRRTNALDASEINNEWNKFASATTVGNNFFNSFAQPFGNKSTAFRSKLEEKHASDMMTRGGEQVRDTIASDKLRIVGDAFFNTFSRKSNKRGERDERAHIKNIMNVGAAEVKAKYDADVAAGNSLFNMFAKKPNSKREHADRYAVFDIMNKGAHAIIDKTNSDREQAAGNSSRQSQDDEDDYRKPFGRGKIPPKPRVYNDDMDELNKMFGLKLKRTTEAEKLDREEKVANLMLRGHWAVEKEKERVAAEEAAKPQKEQTQLASDAKKAREAARKHGIAQTKLFKSTVASELLSGALMAGGYTAKEKTRNLVQNETRRQEREEEIKKQMVTSGLPKGMNVTPVGMKQQLAHEEYEKQKHQSIMDTFITGLGVNATPQQITAEKNRQRKAAENPQWDDQILSNAKAYYKSATPERLLWDKITGKDKVKIYNPESLKSKEDNSNLTFWGQMKEKSIRGIDKYHADLMQGRADRIALESQKRSWFYGAGLQQTQGGTFPRKSGRPAAPKRSPLGGTELAFFGKPFGAPKRLKRSRRGRILKGTRAAARRKEARRPKNFLDNVFGAW